MTVKKKISARVKAALMPHGFCRDCADHFGRCPNTDEACDPAQKATELGMLVANLEEQIADLEKQVKATTPAAEPAKDVFTVYSGASKKGRIMYIGTTVQKPEARFRWHKSNGKNLNFKVLFQFDTAQEMIDKEFELIQELKPALNKITKRKQNFNRALTVADLEERKGAAGWCQSCLKRRVNKGYKVCMFCAKGGIE